MTEVGQASISHYSLSRRTVIGGLASAPLTASLATAAEAGVAGNVTTCPAVADRKGMSPAANAAIREVAVANRILANEGVFDAYGHVSVRHPDIPDHFLLSHSRSPALVAPSDILEYSLDGKLVGQDPRSPYLERYIHGAIYRARPEIRAVAHSHATEVLPFSLTDVPLRPVIHSAGTIGASVPVWDINDRFGDTNFMVAREDQGADLATRLASHNVVLMRGHGFAAAGRNVIELLRICIYLRTNAAVLLEALKLGKVKYLTPGEIELVRAVRPDSPEAQRAWDYWAGRAGCTALLAKR